MIYALNSKIIHEYRSKNKNKKKFYFTTISLSKVDNRSQPLDLTL